MSNLIGEDFEGDFRCRPGLGPISLSPGVAVYPDDGEFGEAALQTADAGLYRAKQAGRNCVVESGER